MTPAMLELSRRNLMAFVKTTKPDYSVGWVHREICGRLMNFLADVMERKSPRLILTMPPRHGKSEIASRRFPAWVFGVAPQMKIITVSYNLDLARSMSRDVQRIMTSDEYREIFPHVSLGFREKGVPSTKRSDMFEIPGFDGAYIAAGVDGGVTGKGANIFIIDDPIKNRKEADSPTIRQNVWEFYTDSARTRLAPGAGIIIIQTRWHQDDLAGRLIAMDHAGVGENYRLVNYPAIAEHDEPHRKEGEALDPQRYDIGELLKLKAVLGSYSWAALYQQRPTPRSGGIFKRSWVRYYDTEPAVFDRVIQSWDLTFKDSESGDFVAGFVLGQIGADIYVLDCEHSKIDFTSQIRAILRMTKKWPMATAKVVEDKANGPAVIATLRSKVPGIIAFNPQGSKEQRANSAAPTVEAGNLLLPRNAPWLTDFENEFFMYPGVEHDDQVDALDQGILYLTQHATRGIAAWL